jgi:hypothetical protein
MRETVEVECEYQSRNWFLGDRVFILYQIGGAFYPLQESAAAGSVGQLSLVRRPKLYFPQTNITDGSHASDFITASGK